MQFAVLGPLAVRMGDQDVEVRRGIPRALLCALAINRGEVVSADVLIDRLWGEALPANPANALQTHIAYLRKILGGPARAPIVTRATGYALEVDPDAVDSYRFERLADEARRLVESGTAASLTAAVDALDAALGLWRGRAYEDIADEPFAQGEATRLEELRLQAAERRIDALLALGRPGDAAGDLAGLVADHPLRERFHEQLVLALYRSGRQADALRAYAQARRVLADELGLDPGPGLRRLERLVLDQSTELDWEPPPGLADTVAGAAAATGQVAGLAFTPDAPLIGRDEELARAGELLGRTRLLTLTGPGGSGKTRLAMALASRASGSRAVHVVDLGAVTEPDDVLPTVAAVLGVDAPGAEGSSAAFGDALAGSDALVVLDTCEHVVTGAAAAAAGLIDASPRISVVATSRRPLGAPGELAWPVPPLRLPAPGEDPRQAAAVQLFLERAAAVAPDRSLDGALDDVAEICRALDGLPLAIELAAAQADVLDPASIRSRLADRFALLVDAGGRSAPRQRTLLSTIEWSVQLLADDQRDLLGRLAVFVGSFDLDGAAAVATTDRASAIAAVLDLARSSLVSPLGDDRYRLLDTVRAYALDNLLSGPAALDARRRHAEHYAAVAEVTFAHVRSPAQARWLSRSRADLGNLRAALDWCFSPSGDERLGARIAGLLAWTWTLDGLLVEASRALERAAAVEDVDPVVRSRVLLGIALLAAPLGDLARAREAAAASAEIARASGNDALAADALITLGVAEWALGDLDQAAATHDEAIERFEAAGDRWGATVSRVLRARTAIEVGVLDVAAKMLDVALDDARTTGDAHVIGLAFDQHARLALAAGDLARAAVAARECLAQNESIGYAEGISAALHVLGRVRRLEGNAEAARALHLRALAVAARIRHTGAVCEALEALAALAAGAGDDTQAALLLLHARRARERRGVPLRASEAAAVDELIATVRERLGGRWDGMAQLVPLTALDDVVEDLLGPDGRAVPAP